MLGIINVKFLTKTSVFNFEVHRIALSFTQEKNQRLKSTEPMLQEAKPSTMQYTCKMYVEMLSTMLQNYH